MCQTVSATVWVGLFSPRLFLLPCLVPGTEGSHNCLPREGQEGWRALFSEARLPQVLSPLQSTLNSRTQSLQENIAGIPVSICTMLLTTPCMGNATPHPAPARRASGI